MIDNTLKNSIAGCCSNLNGYKAIIIETSPNHSITFLGLTLTALKKKYSKKYTLMNLKK